MESTITTSEEKFELRAVIGLTRGLSPADIDALTMGAIRTHRSMVEKADRLSQSLPDDYKSGAVAGGAQHLAYIEACIEMHAQMSIVSTLVDIIGYIPKVPVD